jgi:hypothetical protein
MINEYQSRTAYNEEPKFHRHYEKSEPMVSACVPVRPSVLALSTEQQHLLHEMDKAVSMLSEALTPIMIAPEKDSSPPASGLSSPQSEVYHSLSNNNNYILAIIHRVHSIRECVQV